MKSSIDDKAREGEFEIVKWRINENSGESATRFAGTVFRREGVDYILSRVNHDGTALAFGDGKFTQPLKLLNIGYRALRDVYTSNENTLSCSFIAV